MALKWVKKEKKDEKEMSFLQHLEELRWHIIRSVLAILIFTIIAFLFKNFIFDSIILAPKNPGFFTNHILCQLGETVFNTKSLCINTRPFNLINIKMSGQLTTHIAVSMISGVILAFPYIIWEFWKFFRPALYSKEKQYTKGAVLAATLLFFTGVVFGYYMIVPFSLHFLGTYEISSQVVNQINIRSYIGTLTSIVLASGLIFELPLVTYFLTKIGIITPAFLKKYRRHSIVVIFIIAAIITPPDVFSQTLVAIPLLGLFEIGILISKRVEKKKQKASDDFMNDNDDNNSEKTSQ